MAHQLVRTAFVGLFLFAILSAFHARGETTVWYVDADSTVESPNGQSWATAFPSIQEAIDAAVAAGVSETEPAEVWVAEGTYTGIGGEPHSEGRSVGECVVVMAEHVHLYGGFAGNETSQAERDWVSHETSVDGEDERRGVFGADHATLDGFTLRNGNAVAGGDGAHGGGMLNIAAAPVVRNCSLRKNAAGPNGSGGGMCNINAEALVSGCGFTHNSALFGGGMANRGDFAPTVTNCVFQGNCATPSDYNYYGLGGGMHNLNSAPRLFACVFSENSAYRGGGMTNAESAPVVVNCIFTGNVASQTYVTGSPPCLDSYLTGSGGAICNHNESSPVLTRCTFSGNRSVKGGGGIENSESSLTAVNCTFSSNASKIGGAVLSTDSSLTLTNCTFYGNRARELTSGGGLHAVGGEPVVRNCIFWANGVESIAGDENLTVACSCVQGGWRGPGNIDAYPMFWSPLSGDLRLHLASPCIDRGMADGAPEEDLRGMARPHGRQIDMGAYEMGDADRDGDGLTDDYEDGISNTDPESRDSDGDGIGDGEEWTTFRVWYVDAASEAKAPDGESWESAFPDIQSAIDTASIRGGGEIWVASGIYRGTSESVIVMLPNVRLYGGFSGTETGRSQRDWKRFPTVIDGEATRRVAVGATDTTMDGFTLVNGVALRGAGMYNSHALLDIANCTFSNNHASGGGGAVFSEACSLAVNDCEFVSNTCEGNGGAMCNTQTLATIAGSVFEDNSTDYLGYCDKAPCSCGGPDGGGGGVCNDNAVVDVANCLFTGNAAAGEDGGGMFSISSTLSATNCVFQSNSARSEGGGMYDNGSTVSVTNCVLSGNLSDYDGGGMYSVGSSLVATNCVFHGNQAGEGGGGILDDSKQPVLFSQCTFYGNSAGEGGGGILALEPGLSVRNSVLWGNGEGVYDGAQIAFSCVEGGVAGEGNIDIDPLLADPENGDLSLRFDSPCIDAGTADGAPRMDIDGVSRPQGADFDMGAYEFFVGVPQDADWHGGVDNVIDLTELLRVIQLYKAGGYHCASVEDDSDEGFMPYADAARRDCTPYTLDYDPRDWVVGFEELLRAVQYFNSSGYHPCVDGEDFFCPGLADPQSP